MRIEGIFCAGEFNHISNSDIISFSLNICSKASRLNLPLACQQLLGACAVYELQKKSFFFLEESSKSLWMRLIRSQLQRSVTEDWFYTCLRMVLQPLSTFSTLSTKPRISLSVNMVYIKNIINL